jgi:UDP-N-acetyl-2-amino-2-deoxyglucuronate dehydrogenase
VRWFLSIDARDLPETVSASGKTTFRSIALDSEEIEFSEGFTDLHTRIYEDILGGGGFGIADARASIELVHNLREAPVSAGSRERRHPLLCRDSV